MSVQNFSTGPRPTISGSGLTQCQISVQKVYLSLKLASPIHTCSFVNRHFAGLVTGLPCLLESILFEQCELCSSPAPVLHLNKFFVFMLDRVTVNTEIGIAESLFSGYLHNGISAMCIF